MKNKLIFSIFLLCLLLTSLNNQVSAINSVDVIWIHLTEMDFTSYPGHIIPRYLDAPEATFEAYISDKTLYIQCDNVDSEFNINIVAADELVLDGTFINENNVIEIPTDEWSKGSYIIRIYYGEKMWIGEFQIEAYY